MPQEQRIVTLILKESSEGEAVATGNNAAWLCPCGYERPLLGCSGTSEGLRVDCPVCDRTYFIIPEAGPRTSVVRVEESK